jgi:hypothetical protein
MATAARKTVKTTPAAKTTDSKSSSIPVKTQVKKQATELKSMELDFRDEEEKVEIKTPFVTTRPGPIRYSEPVLLKGLSYDENRREIKAFGSDGKLRTCQIARLVGETEAARVLWKKLSESGRAKTPIRFAAAGGFNPNQWFFNIILAE